MGTKCINPISSSIETLQTLNENTSLSTSTLGKSRHIISYGDAGIEYWSMKNNYSLMCSEECHWSKSLPKKNISYHELIRDTTITQKTTHSFNSNIEKQMESIEQDADLIFREWKMYLKRNSI